MHSIPLSALQDVAWMACDVIHDSKQNAGTDFRFRTLLHSRALILTWPARQFFWSLSKQLTSGLPFAAGFSSLGVRSSGTLLRGSTRVLPEGTAARASSDAPYLDQHLAHVRPCSSQAPLSSPNVRM